MLTFIDAVSKDGPALATTGLAIGEYGGVIALPGILQDAHSEVVKYLVVMMVVITIGMLISLMRFMM